MNPQKSPSFPPSGSPSLPWGSPALRPTASFPPANKPNNFMNIYTTPPHRAPMPRMTRPFRPTMGTGSPHVGMPFHSSFRTPQPQPRQQSPNHFRGSWSENRSHRGRGCQGNNGSRHNSPRDSPSMNPGGSDNILLYYHPAMMKDPWLDTPPQSVDFWKS